MQREQTEEFQSVYFIIDWWDGPKSGFADFNSSIHYFERLFDSDKEEWSNSYLLRPVSTEVYALQIESYQIFLDWVNEKDSKSPHPLTDHENKRYHEIKRLLEHIEYQFYSAKYIGNFIHTGDKANENGINGLNIFKVKWTRDD